MTADLKKLVKRFNAAANAHEEVADCLKEPENKAFHQGSAIAFRDAAKFILDVIGCVTCRGEGTVDYALPGETGSGENLVHADCPDCKGDGVKS
jgi:hypothetical protein